jgi:hypothetical protein
MKLLQKSVLIAILGIWSEVSSAQNWMMAQKYMTIAIDSLIQKNWPNTGKLSGLRIHRIEFDDIFNKYTIQFTEPILSSKTVKSMILLFKMVN